MCNSFSLFSNVYYQYAAEGDTPRPLLAAYYKKECSFQSIVIYKCST